MINTNVGPSGLHCETARGASGLHACHHAPLPRRTCPRSSVSSVSVPGSLIQRRQFALLQPRWSSSARLVCQAAALLKSSSTKFEKVSECIVAQTGCGTTCDDAWLAS
eukprot:693297-Pelagomonas_calceolata.AAC.4